MSAEQPAGGRRSLGHSRGSDESGVNRTDPDCWTEGLFSPGIAAVPTTILLQRYAEVFGGRKRVYQDLAPAKHLTRRA
jgi:hypothetical protein